MVSWINQSRTKFSLWVIIIMLVTLFLITGIVVLQIVRQSKADYLSGSTEQMKIVSTTLNNYYTSVYEDIDALANDPLIMSADTSITSYMNAPESQMTPSQNGGIEQAIYDKFDLYGRTHKGTVYIYLAEANGSYIEWPETVVVANYDPTKRPWYAQGVSGNGRVVSTDPYIHLLTHSVLTSNLRSFYDQNGQFKGVVGIDIKGDVISDMLHELKIGKTGYYMMIHQNGIIMADGSNAQNNLKNINDIGITGLSQVFSTSGEPFKASLDGTAYIVNPYKIKDSDWVLASFIAEEELSAGALRLTKIISAFAFILLVVIGLLSRLFIHQNNTIFSMLYYDGLTKLNNRHSMFKTLDNAIKNEKKNGLMAIIFLNIDQFQMINNTYGQDTGDDVLKFLGNQLKALENNSVSIGRMSGDEFIIFLRNQESLNSITNLADQILGIFSENIFLNGKTMYLTASMGIALYSEKCNQRNLLTRNADLALKKAKESGKNKYVLYEDSLNIELEEKILFQNAIRAAIKNHEFFLNYQPVIDIQKGRIAGYEALIRWVSADYGYVSPLKLIMNIEEMGMIIEVGEWILRESCNFAKSINLNSSTKVRVSVNISTIQLMSNNFPERTALIVADEDISADPLCLEVTETVLMESLQKGLNVIQNLRAQGFKIALDDFGTGYSSLSYLNPLPIDILKIDKTFVDNVIHDKYSQHIVNVLINLAKFKNMAVICEGVENGEQLETLALFGCSMFQGYLFAKPLEKSTALLFHCKPLSLDWIETKVQSTLTV